MEVDPKRTGVKATLVEWKEPVIQCDEHARYFGPPGAIVERSDRNGSRIICCPGCGQLGAPAEGQSWRATAGSWDEIEKLSLEPSILKHCCGWHGYLRNGVFESC